MYCDDFFYHPLLLQHLISRTLFYQIENDNPFHLLFIRFSGILAVISVNQEMDTELVNRKCYSHDARRSSCPGRVVVIVIVGFMI